MMMKDHSKSKQKSNSIENQKLMTMKINSSKNGSGIASFILLGGALITAVAMGSVFLIQRKRKKSTKKITKKEGNEKIEDESSRVLPFLLPDSSSPCIEQQQPTSNGTDKLYVNDNDSTSLFSTPCLIQDEKPKLGTSDEKGDTLNAIVSDHPNEEGKSPSFQRLPEELELLETKISLLPDPDQELDEVCQVRIEVIQGNEKTEVLAHVHQAKATIFSNPALQMDNKRELLVHNDKGESNELQHAGMIETDNHEKGPIQEQEKQATGDQETINPDDGSLQETSTTNEHEPLNSAFELMKIADEDEDKDHLQSMYFEEQCADAETQIDQFTKKCNLQMQFSDEEECAEENDLANSCYEKATSENSPCRTYSIAVKNLPASAIRNASIDDERSAEAYEDENKGHMRIMYFEEQCVDVEITVDQIAKKCNPKMQFSDEQVHSNENDQASSCYEEATSENIHCRTYSMDAQNLAVSEIRNASVDDHHSAEVIKETNAMDPAASGEQSLETEQLVEKQSFEPNSQGNGLKENEVEESVFVNKEEGEDVDYYDNDVEKDDAAEEVEDISGGEGNSTDQSNSDKIWAADSNQDLLLELNEKKVKEGEEGMKIEKEPFRVENCNLKSTQNDVAITSGQQSYDGKGDSAVNVIERHQMKLMYLDDVAAITRGRRVFLGALLVLIWYFVLKCILPSDISGFKILNQ